VLQLADDNDAYAVQDATLQAIGAVGGWKVGARSRSARPTCAPLPAIGLLPDGAHLKGPAWRLRGIESEVGFVLRTGLPPRPEPYGVDDVAAAIEAVLPVIEVVETRLDDWLGAGSRAQLADLLSHGALILGQRQAFDRAWFDLSSAEAVLRFDEQVVAHTVGEHPSQDVGRLLAWLANHCAARGTGLKAGQVITTGSCTGMLFASEGTQVQMAITGLAPLRVSF
jgi:2-keto-4-pentenoate hydratase